MLTVSVLINGKPIYTRTAVNVTHKTPQSLRAGFEVYQLDDGKVLNHNADKGAVDLAIKMLKTVVEVK